MTVLLWIANRHDEHLLEVTLKKIIKKQQNMMTRSLLRPCDSQLSLINNNSTFVLNVLMLVKMQHNEIFNWDCCMLLIVWML